MCPVWDTPSGRILPSAIISECSLEKGPAQFRHSWYSSNVAHHHPSTYAEYLIASSRATIAISHQI